MTRSLWIVSICILILFFGSIGGNFSCKALSDGVRNVNTGLSYSTIQDAINDPQTLNGHKILVAAGEYHEQLTIDKALTLIGQGVGSSVIDGEGGVALHVQASKVHVQGFTIRQGIRAVFVDHSNGTVLSDNLIREMVSSEDYAIYVSYSDNCTISRNVVAHNAGSGILVTNSEGFLISHNDVSNNGLYGINANASRYGVISYNNASNNYFDGIGLGEACSNCTIMRNNVVNNSLYGIWLDNDSENNSIFDNNLVENSLQARALFPNAWNAHAEGNYWDDYAGVDSDFDGIGDSPRIIDESNVDHFPLAGRLVFFETSARSVVSIASNSSLLRFAYSALNGTITISVLNVTPVQTSGFCRMQIPYTALGQILNVTVDGEKPDYANYSIYDDGQSRWIYFAYSHSEREIVVHGEPPSDTIPPNIVILSPEMINYESSEVPLTFTTDESVNWIAYSLDSQTNVTVTNNMTLAGLINGSHSIVMYAQDETGNVGVSEVVYFVTVTSHGEPIPFWVVIVIVVVAFAAIGGLAYLARFRKRQIKTES